MCDKTLLLDGDILLYKYCCINEYLIKWEEGVQSDYLNLERSKEDFDLSIPQMLKATDCTRELICFSSPINFRYSILPSYKQNRKDLEKPKMFYDLQQYVIDNYKTKIREPLEADDVMGILATKYPNKYVIGSIDKDLRQIPGIHYNWKTGEIFEIDEFEADIWFYIQVLTGDSSDGYKGCPGIGRAKAEKLLLGEWADGNEHQLWWERIVKAYEAKGLTEADALQQARVARILRAEDWDWEKGNVKLWVPKKGGLAFV